MIPSFKQFLAVNEAAKYTNNKNHSLIAMHGLSLRDQVHLFHWQTEIGDQHKALGEFYEDFIEKLDDLMEAIMGKYGRISVASIGTPKPLVDLKSVNVEDFIGEQTNIFNEFKESTFSKDPEILNIIDEILASIEKLKYLLTMS